MYNTSDTQTTVVIACVASLSVGYFVFLKHFLLFGHAKIGARVKNGRKGKGRGEKEVSFFSSSSPSSALPPPHPNFHTVKKHKVLQRYGKTYRNAFHAGYNNCNGLYNVGLTETTSVTINLNMFILLYCKVHRAVMYL